MTTYGKELLLDMHKCNKDLMTEEIITEYFKTICNLIQMEPVGKPIFWNAEGIDPEEYENSPHLQGVSALQWIKTSSIVVHAITGLGQVYVNIFSCKNFDCNLAEGYTIGFFEGIKASCLVTDRM